jgi:hypothetical protein
MPETKGAAEGGYNEVAIPFQPYFKRHMRDGRKLVTSRTKQLAETDDTFVAFGCRFLVLGVHRRPLCWVRDYLWWFEGCDSPAAFVRVWVGIHKRAGWTPERPVWVHAFGRIE